MPDQSSDTKKTAIKIAMGAALGGALGITAALRDTQGAGSEQQVAGNEQQVEGSVVGPGLEPPSQEPDTQHSPDHPDWERLPAAHLPRPTYWPVVLAVGIMFFAWGIVTTIAITVIGLVLFALGLGGWIGELRHGH